MTAVRGWLMAATAVVVIAGGPAMARPSAFAPPARRMVMARMVALRRAWIANHGSATSPRDSLPAVLSGKVLTPSLNVTAPPAGPAIQLKFKAPSSGLSYLYVEAVAPDGQQYQSVNYQPPYMVSGPTSGTLVLQRPGSFGLYSEPGTWTISYIVIEDGAGNYVTYDSSQIAGLISTPSFTVANPNTPDTTAPTVTKGKIFTKTVSLGSAPVFKASLTTADDLSGVQYAYLFLTPPGGTSSSYDAYSDLPAPVAMGEVTTYDYLGGSSAPTGTWTVSGYEVCDAAGNCFYDATPADVSAAFGGVTTFKVTN